ncbi:hypothetical protein JOD02_002078 [Caldicoprobacter guelmensis]|nr:hypothetical protein [Caldicoprobacter guelmensis]
MPDIGDNWAVEVSYVFGSGKYRLNYKCMHCEVESKEGGRQDFVLREAMKVKKLNCIGRCAKVADNLGSRLSHGKRNGVSEDEESA